MFQTGFGRAATSAELALYGSQLASQSRGKVVQNIIDAVSSYAGSDILLLGTQSGFHSKLAGGLASLLLDAAQFSATAATAAGLLQGAAAAKVATPYLGDLKVAMTQTTTAATSSRRGTEISTDRWGNVLSITDPRNPNYRVHYRYNHDNQQIDQTVYVLGGGTGAPHSETRYDALGRIAARIDAMGNKNSYGYDSNGNLVKEYHADGGVVTSHFNLFGDRTALEQPGSGGTVVRTDYAYDHLGRMTQSIMHNVHVTYSDNNKGDMGRKFVGYRTLTEYYEYDELGRRTGTLYDEYGDRPFGAPVRKYANRMDYDMAGNLTVLVSGTDPATYTSYNALGQKIGERDGAGRTMSWTYDQYGRVASRTDKGRATMTYAYNGLGQQVLLTSKERVGYDQQRIEHVYENGLLSRIIDHTTKTETRYSYDVAGRRLTEQTAIQENGIEVLVQNNRIAYDAQGRMARVQDDRFQVDFAYDANGNRTRVTTRYTNSQGKPIEADVHSEYDRMNRATVVNGDMVNGVVVKGKDGHQISYDQAGRRETDTYLYKNQVSGDMEETTERYFYDNAGRLDRVVRDGVVVERRYYDELGRVIQTGPEEDADTERLKAFGISPVIQVYAYNEEGNLDRMKSWTLDGKMLDDIYYKSGATTGYDGAGTLNFYTVVPNSGSNTLYTNSYTYFDSAKETQVTANRGGTIAITTSLLDANGNVYQVSDSGAADKTRTFVSDAFGRVLRTTQNGSVTHTMIVNGEVLGSNSDSAVAANFGSAYQSGLSNANLATPTVYNVQSSGENLRSIAKSVWGDATLWYLIADANNLAQDAQLNAGQLLKIPARVNTVHNDADTFKTYNAAEAIGDTRPTLPPPPAKKGCGGMGQLIMVVVAVAVASVLGPMATSLLEYAMVGAASSLASQTAGMAMGMQDGINWKSVGLAAAGAAATAGINNVFNGTGATGMLSGNDWTAVAGRAMLSNAAAQGIGNLTGLQKGFDWRSVAAAGAGAAVGNYVSKELKLIDASGKAIPRQFGDQLWRAATASFTAGATTALMRGGKIAVTQVAIDAFGNALGSSLVENSKPRVGVSSNESKPATEAQTIAMSKGFGPLTDHAAQLTLAASEVDLGSRSAPGVGYSLDEQFPIQTNSEDGERDINMVDPAALIKRTSNFRGLRAEKVSYDLMLADKSSLRSLAFLEGMRYPHSYESGSYQRVLGDNVDFDRIRRAATVNKVEDIKYDFPGINSSVDAQLMDISIGGNAFKMIYPKYLRGSENGFVLPDSSSILKSLETLDDAQLRELRTVTAHPYRNPDDLTLYAKQRNDPNFRSAATAGAGDINIYPGDTYTNLQSNLDSTMGHETGHLITDRAWQKHGARSEWEAAIKSDARSLSSYGDQTIHEDFAEAVVMYKMSKGRPLYEPVARNLFPARYGILEKMLAPKPNGTK